MTVFVVTMYMDGNRSKFSYVLGVYTKIEKAIKQADREEFQRGKKWKSEILMCPTDYINQDKDTHYTAIRKL